jgi:hypothetical protein
MAATLCTSLQMRPIQQQVKLFVFERTEHCYFTTSVILMHQSNCNRSVLSFNYSTFNGSLSGTLTSLCGTQNDVMPLNDSNQHVEMLENETVTLAYLICSVTKLPKWSLITEIKNVATHRVLSMRVCHIAFSIMLGTHQYS